MLWLRYDALPNADRYRAEITSSIEKSSGMKVSARSISGGWSGLRPVVNLEGVAIVDRKGKAALDLLRAEVSLSWWSLLLGEVRFHDVDLYRPELVLRRGADGLIYLADKPLNEDGPDDDGAFMRWLLSQPRLGIHDAVLVWRDDFLGASEVRLTRVEIAVERRHGRHRIALTAVPPRELARSVDMRADLTLSRLGSAWRAAGSAYAETRDADLGMLREHLPVPDTLRNGAGNLRLWSQFTHEGVKEAVADLNMRDAKAQLAADALPLELASISGRATYRARDDGFSLATQGLRFRLASGVEAQPGNFSVERTATPGTIARMEVKADGIDLKIAAALADYFPLPREMKSQVQRFAPRGRISNAALAWSDDGAKTYSVRGRFEDLAVNATDAIPGVGGLTGSIEGTQAGGALRLDSRKATLDIARAFRAPLAFDRLDGTARWKHVGRALHLDIESAHFANSEIEGQLAGAWRSLPDSQLKSPGFADIRGTLSRALLSRAGNYTPNNVAEPREWLDRSLQQGELTRASFEVKGDLYEFPFGKGSNGHFLFEGDVRNARLRYHPEWPSVDSIDGSLRFENRRLEIQAKSATIFASRVKSASAVVEDLLMRPPVLALDLDIETTGADSVRFLRETPLVDGPGAFTRAVAIDGPARFKLHMDYPLWGADPVRLSGDYLFARATASVGKAIVMRDVTGRLNFTERGLRAPAISGVLFGHPAVLAMSTEPDGRVLAAIDGRIATAGLAEYVPAPILARMDGAIDWKARVLSGKLGTDLTVTSDLKGLAVTLPAPLAKGVQESRLLTINMARVGSENEVTTAVLQGGIHSRVHRVFEGDAEPRWQMAIKAGAPVGDEPRRDGLFLYGQVAALDVDAWLAVFAEPRKLAVTEGSSAAGFELRGVDLRMERVRYLGREFAQMGARLSREANQWSGTLASPLVAGTVRWDPQGRGRVVAKLERLAIPAPAPGVAVPDDKSQENDLPALDVSAEKFDFLGRFLGSLELRAEPAGEEWRIERLDIVNGHAQLKASGVWRRTAAASLTRLDVKLESANLNALMDQFGFGEYMKRGSGRLEGTLVWPGYPNEFSTEILSGTFKVNARSGQFAKIEPGAGKLLGLLSLQSLPRRALFDFRDVFNQGFAFERIEGDVKVARGVLLTDDFEISGPSAFVSLVGEVSLPQETQALTVRVVPEVGEGLALAATVLGTPVLGLSTLLVSKLLKNPLGKAVAYEYQVTGSWDNPVVSRTSAPPAKAATAAVPAPASAAQ